MSNSRLPCILTTTYFKTFSEKPCRMHEKMQHERTILLVGAVVLLQVDKPASQAWQGEGLGGRGGGGARGRGGTSQGAALVTNPEA